MVSLPKIDKIIMKLVIECVSCDNTIKAIYLTPDTKQYLIQKAINEGWEKGLLRGNDIFFCPKCQEEEDE